VPQPNRPSLRGVETQPTRTHPLAYVAHAPNQAIDSQCNIIDGRRHTNLAIVCILVQAQTVPGDDLVHVMCSFTQKASASGGRSPDPLPGLRLDPTQGLPSRRPQSSFISPNNPVRSTPLRWTTGPQILKLDTIKLLVCQLLAVVNCKNAVQYFICFVAKHAMKKVVYELQ